MSIESGISPNKWKEAKVIPIHKSGALNDRDEDEGDANYY